MTGVCKCCTAVLVLCVCGCVHVGVCVCVCVCVCVQTQKLTRDGFHSIMAAFKLQWKATLTDTVAISELNGRVM